MSETKPSAQTIRERLEAEWNAGVNRPIPALLDVLDDRDVKLAQIAALPYVTSEKDKRMAAQEAASNAAADKARDAAIRAGTRHLDDEEGAIRQALHKGGDPNLAARASFLMAQVGAASAPEVIDSLFANAALAELDEVIRAVALVAQQQYEQLMARAKSPAQRQAVDVARNAFQSRADAWMTAHPAPAERLRMIARERAAVTTLIQMSADHAVAMYRAARLRLQGRNGVQTGPAWDRRAEEHPLTGHEIRR